MVILLVTGPPGAQQDVFADILKEKHGYRVFQIKSATMNNLWNFDKQEMIAENREEIIKETKELIAHSLKSWREDTVIFPIFFPECIESITKKRSYFKTVGVTGPLDKRFANFSSESSDSREGMITKDQFIVMDDFMNYEAGVSECLKRADVQLINLKGREDLEKKIEDHDLLTKKVFRPSWDIYFMKIAHIVRERSNCMKRSVGAIIVQENRIVSTGYNGTPRKLLNCYQGGCERCNGNKGQGEALDQCNCIHAEENSVLECGVIRAKGATVYTTLSPCRWCTKILIQAQVKRVVYDEKYSDRGTDALLEEAGIEVDCVSIDV